VDDPAPAATPQPSVLGAPAALMEPPLQPQREPVPTTGTRGMIRD
jgi:hypothetical protein